jgi:tRNA pseudouridine55 synthase
MAEKLGVCGHVSSLKRLSVGGFNIKNTISLDFIEQLVHTGGPSELERYLYPLHTVLDGILVQYVSEEQSQKLRLGQKVPVNLTQEELVVAMLGEKLVAMCNVKDGFLHPIRVFNI